MKGAYYNEIDPFVADWLRNLIMAGHIPAGDVDERSIADVRANELSGYVQCHFFAGLGGWPHALRLARWPDDRPVWTGSCPCPPFSAAGKGSECPSCGGKSCLSHPLVTAGWLCLDCGDEWRGDDRHLLPEFLRLWLECRPPDVFGEQVASRDGVLWLHTLRATVGLGGYALGAADLPSAGFGAPHIRQRLMFGSFRLADADRDEQRPGREHRGASGERLRLDADGRGCGGGMGVSTSIGCERERHQSAHGEPVPAGADARRLGDAEGERGRGGSGNLPREAGASEGAPSRQGDGNADRADGPARGLADDESSGRGEERPYAGGLAFGDRAEGFGAGPLAGGGDHGPGHNGGPGPTNGFWRDADWIFCRDGKWRPVEPGTCPLAHGVPARVGRLRAYGNAINPIQGAEFITAFDGTRDQVLRQSVDHRGNVAGEAA